MGVEERLKGENGKMKSDFEQTEIEAPYKLPEGWKWIPLLKSFENKTSSNKKLPTKDYSDAGKYAIIDQGQEFIGGYSDKTDFVFDGELPIIVFGDHTKCIKYIDFPFIQGADGVKILKPISIVDSKYFYYALQNIHFPDLGYRRHFPIFKDYQFPLPPTLAEQQRIVNRIESMFAKLDEAKEKAQNVVDGFETRKAAILHKAFSGELTAKWRKENGIEKNKELDFIYNFAQTLSKKDMTNITDFQKQAYDYVLSDGAVWKKCCIGAIGVITNGSTPSRKEASFWNGNIPWVSSGEVANNIIESTNEMISEEGFNNSSVKKLPIGTVLIAMIGEGKTRGQTSVLNIEATTNQNIAAIIINHGHVESKFLWYWLQKEYKNNRTAGNGSGPQALNCQKVRELPFILPTLPEQVEIVRILDIIIEKENKAKQAAEAVLEQIDLLKKSILARAFRGEL